MKKQQFKALPLDPRVLQSCGEMGVPRVDKKPVTQVAGWGVSYVTYHTCVSHTCTRQPQAPVFKTDSRAGRRPSVMDEPSFELFRARPCPQFQSRAATPERGEAKLTMPTSPNLSYRYLNPKP